MEVNSRWLYPCYITPGQGSEVVYRSHHIAWKSNFKSHWVTIFLDYISTFHHIPFTLTGWIGGVHSQHCGAFAGHTGHRRWSQWCATAWPWWIIGSSSEKNMKTNDRFLIPARVPWVPQGADDPGGRSGHWHRRTRRCWWSSLNFLRLYGGFHK